MSEPLPPDAPSPEPGEAPPTPEAGAAPLAPDGTPLAAEVEGVGGAGGYRVELPTFEGPLDLLLHLIEEHELDIFDIPIAFVAAKVVE